ncbi:unnamed protein product [Sphenostylis stenocarpa]|uniref:Uncharacterized protein n=1 Tax=Sphenostylis stenocarpa TaxID=92480 RepID=A0AA86S956_9FABA|nr:unnamed protein product [Sphenostylis stenocarpa]
MTNVDIEEQDSCTPETSAKSKLTGQYPVEDDVKKRKDREEINDDNLPRKVPKKVYRPKVFSQITNRTNKSHAKGRTPKPSTPKQRTSYVRTRQLFTEGSSVSNNELGIEYNSLQSYQTLSYLSGSCLLQSRQIGPNFPLLFKKKRAARQKACLKKFLIPFQKGTRSKSFVRRRRDWVDFSVEGSTFKSKKLITRIRKVRIYMKKGGRNTEKLFQLVPYKRSMDVLLDEETLRVWNLLKEEKGHEEHDQTKKQYWDFIRKLFQLKVESFIEHMHVIQGDRRFLPWKGSVLDSVIGVFLTQNVADYLSSNAYMTLASKFPVKNYEPNGITNNVDCNTKREEGVKEKKVEEKEEEKVEKVSEKVDFVDGEKKSNEKKSKNKEEKEKLMEEKREYWNTLRKIHTKEYRESDEMDSVDWEAVRRAKAKEVAATISARGQHNIIGGRIQHLLNNLMHSNGSLDLEWLRHAPPKEVKEYLLTIHGLGLKSVECIRLLTLCHSAFPVDINVARIVVRLGWVPIQPLPESIQIHNLEMFPDSNKIQQYLWPRLCTLDPRQLYYPSS